MTDTSLSVTRRRGGEAFAIDAGPPPRRLPQTRRTPKTSAVNGPSRSQLITLPTETQPEDSLRASNRSDTDAAVPIAPLLDWVYERPPNNQKTFRFPLPADDRTEDGGCITFSSEFDSGNMINVTNPTPYHYEIHTASDCQGSPQEVSNKAWWYFSVSGVPRGVTLSLTIVAVPWCRSFTFGYAPVVACCPQRPSFSRVSSRISIVPAANPPPRLPLASGVCCPSAADQPMDPAPSQEEEPKRSNPTHVDISFDFLFESDDSSLIASSSSGRPLAMPVTYVFANTFPYSYSRLQRHLSAWVPHSPLSRGLSSAPRTIPDPPTACMRFPTPSDGNRSIPLVGASVEHRIYTHRETLCLSLDDLPVDLITITGSNGMNPCGHREPLFSPTTPISSVWHLDGSNPDRSTLRPVIFPDKRFVVLSARVHPGEVPASHMLHGAVEFLLNATDPRAEALRRHFVFIAVPMINPDGVARGHSRADTLGQNLNRMYKNPCRRRQPTCFALRELLLATHKTGRLALYVDLHAHSNKKGAFLFGNAMNAVPQIQNLLYARLLTLNSPYVDFGSSNFSEHNMFVAGKGGGGKDGSSRVVLFTETGFTHSYTLEMNYITGPPLNSIAALSNIPGEDMDVVAGTPCPKYNVACFHDVGRGVLVSLLDLHGLNPVSRIALTAYRNVRGIALWIQRSLLLDAWEQQRRIQALAVGIPLSTALARGTPGKDRDETALLSLATQELPLTVTTRPSPDFPLTTTHRLSELASAFTAASNIGHSRRFGEEKKSGMGRRGTVERNHPSGLRRIASSGGRSGLRALSISSRR